MSYSISPASKPGFPVIIRSERKVDDGIPITWEWSAVFTEIAKDEATKYVLARVPTAYGVGWIIVGECDTFSPDAVLKGLAEGSINVPSEAWK